MRAAGMEAGFLTHEEQARFASSHTRSRRGLLPHTRAEGEVRTTRHSDAVAPLTEQGNAAYSRFDMAKSRDCVFVDLSVRMIACLASSVMTSELKIVDVWLKMRMKLSNGSMST